MVKDRIMALRELMAERNIDVYLVPSSDFHGSEYVGDYFACREFITGFTGSAGTAVITKTEAGLWTDGRYFIQAASELKESTVKLFKMGQEDVPTVEEYLIENLPEKGRLGFDGRVIDAKLGNQLEKVLSKKNITIAYDEDLIGVIWKERPEMSKEPVFTLDVKYAGKSAEDKIAQVRKAMKDCGANTHILTSLPDINWLLNIRGNDIYNTPVVLSYLILEESPPHLSSAEYTESPPHLSSAEYTEKKAYLFINEETLNNEAEEYLKKIQVEVLPYEQIYEFIKKYKETDTILLDSNNINYTIWHSVAVSATILDENNPTILPKSIKNPIEVENIKKAHIKDGVAITKFMYWLKTNIGKTPMSELHVENYLEGLRKEQEGYIEPSFRTISAYKENGAMCHYKATEESNKELAAEGLLLVDSGGHYFEGTTDITRTFVLGPITEEMKLHFTLVAASMLRLGNAKFLYGCGGMSLDYIARGPLWERGLDFNHGTGHGVGYLLSVHEPPNGIRYKKVSERQDSSVLEEGMITSDEPGLYFEGSHGIRTENLTVCKKAGKNEYGQFMEFEFLTFAPIDLDGIVKRYLSEKEIQLLNTYHQEVFRKISPYLTEEESNWLKEYTKEI